VKNNTMPFRHLSGASSRVVTRLRVPSPALPAVATLDALSSFQPGGKARNYANMKTPTKLMTLRAASRVPLILAGLLLCLCVQAQRTATATATVVNGFVVAVTVTDGGAG
jgi:hypothetical protein